MSRRDYDDGYDDRRSHVSRRPRQEREYDEVDIEARSRYDGPAPSRYDPPQRSRREETIVKERDTDTVMTQGNRTERPGRRQPEFLREDYGRSANAGELVVRERREEDEYVGRAPSRRRSTETVRSSRPAPARTERVENDEYVFREQTRDRGGPPYPRSERGSFGEEEKVVFRERTSSRPPPTSGRSKEEIDIRIREEQRPDWSPPPRGYREQDNVEEVRFRRGDGDRRSPPAQLEVDSKEIKITSTERTGPPPRRTEVEREEVTFQASRSPPPRESTRGREVRKEEIDIDVRDRSANPPRQRSMSRGQLVRKEREEWIVRRPRTPSPSPPRDFEKEQIVIKRKEWSPSPVREPTPEPPPPQLEPPIYRPPIIQEVITHHRHIDHGIERPRSPTPPPPTPSPPKDEDLEISIRRQGTRNGKSFDEEITLEKETTERKDRSRAVSRDARLEVSSREITRQRSVSRDVSTRGGRRYEDDVSAEADYYNRRVSARGYPGEAYNGATRDWGLADIPPGTERVRMDGVGGGAQEITWSRYNGKRHGKFIAGDRVYDESWGNGGPRPSLPPPRPEPREEVRETQITKRTTVEERGTASRSRNDRRWTEITKDLVIKEAIEEAGYEYEETDGYFYVMVYLRYEDVQKLVEVTEDIRRERRERLREIAWQRDELDRQPKMLPPPMPYVPPPPRGGGGRYDERVVEKEVMYDRGPDRRRYR